MTSKRNQASDTTSRSPAAYGGYAASEIRGGVLLTRDVATRRDVVSKRDVISRRSVLSGLFVSAAAVGCSSFIDGPGSDGDTPSRHGTSPDTSRADSLPEARPPIERAAPDVSQSPTAASSGAGSSASPEASADSTTRSDGSTSADSTTRSDGPNNDEQEETPADEDPRMFEVEGDGSGQIEVTEEDVSEAPDTLPDEPITMGKTAADRVVLGASGVEVSRMAMGSGTRGYDYSSDQVKLGAQFGQLLVDAYDQGITFFDCADTYGSHFLAAEAAAKVGRDKVQILTKSHATTREEMQADLDRFLEELGTDYIDILLLHNRSSSTWTEDFADCMEVLADAKRAGKIRAHGVSCHSIEATQLACRSDWVDVNLIRINPFNLHMDADPATVLSAIDQAKAANHGVIGMKILGAGQAVNRMDEAINHAIRLDSIDAFTIGFTSRAQMDEVTAKIAAVTPA